MSCKMELSVQTKQWLNQLMKEKQTKNLIIYIRGKTQLPSNFPYRKYYKIIVIKRYIKENLVKNVEKKYCRYA